MAAPPFIMHSPRASLAEVIKYWAPDIGCDEVTLRRGAVRRIWRCRRNDALGWNGRGCCGRRVSSLEFGELRACRYREVWAEFEPHTGACDRAACDLIWDHAALAWLAAVFGLAMPPWHDQWRQQLPRDWHDIVVDRLRERGSPARRPGGWKQFARDVRGELPKSVTKQMTKLQIEQFDVSIIRYAQRRLTNQRKNDKSDKSDT